jgi:glycerophosphoryl diester phosphodiesterase
VSPLLSRPRVRLLLAGYALAIPTFVLIGGWDLVQLHTGWGLSEREGAPMTLIAHRGDLERFPENTLEAIISATELEIDGIEFDVQRSADGTWWVLHDRVLDTTTTGSGRVARLDDATIAHAEIKGGFGFQADRHTGFRVPRLTDVLKALERYEGMLIVDLQHAESGSAAELASVLAGRRASVLCRTLADAVAVKSVDPGIRTLLRYRGGPAEAGVDGWLAEAVHEATVSNVREASLPVTTYLDEWRFGGDEGPALRRAWASGVDGFLTKRPREAIAQLVALGNSQ